MAGSDNEIKLEELGDPVEKNSSSLSSLHVDDALDSDDGITSYERKTGQLESSTKQAICSNTPDSLDAIKQWLDSIKESQPEMVNAFTEDGKTALHIAAECNNLKVAQLLCQAGADPSLLDEEKKLALHIACSLPMDEDVAELVTALVEINSPIEQQDEDMYTPLHHAAMNGHLAAVKLLLDKGADMTVKDEIGDTPVHAAAAGGHAEVVREMIGRDPSCVKLHGYDEETPLHQAAEGGHFNVVQIVLKAKPDMNAVTDDGSTPLGSVAASGSTQVAKLLVENGALVNPPVPANEHYRNPFHKAAYYGYPELALYLLGKGATVSAWAFQEIVNEGYEEIAAAVVKSSQWPVALRHTYTDRGHETTPFRELIRKMPDVAEDVLNKCAVEDPDVQEHGDEFYGVVYNYEFIEDFKDGTEPREETDGAKKKKSKQKETYGCGYKEILTRSRDCHFHWGPSKFTRFHHPLAIMVRKKRLNLLSHPVVGSLLHHKWNKFGQYGYFFNLLIYCVFLIFLTAFALVVPNPQEPFCTENSTVSSSSVMCGGISDSSKNFLYVAPAVVILFALCRLLVEIAQLISLKLSYVTDWVNCMEVTLFVCSIIFVWVYTNKCQCVLDWQWQIGVVAVFLGWIDLIIFISKFPLTGIYVLMFIKILYTFLKMLVLTLLLVIAFGITFYMVFFDPAASRSPFSDAPRSLLKTMAMTTGELGYDDIFRLDYSTDPGDVVEIAYLPISVILWIAFIVLMPILLTNMLVGLAVGDIEAIQNEAQLQKLALQVEQVLTMEELLPQKLRNKFRSTYKEVFPNAQHSKFVEWVTKIGFVIWGGERYDSPESISKVLHPSSDLNEDILQKTNSLVQEVEEIKQAVCQYQELKSLVEEIARKHGIDVPDPSMM